jgi:hypothetical protein
MLSFSAVRADVAKDLSKIRYMRPPTNRRIIELWQRARAWATGNVRSSEPSPVSSE